jgi:hypothetical protein
LEPITLRNMGSGLWIISNVQLDPSYGHRGLHAPQGGR